MEQIEVTWRRGLKVWWSFVWRASVLMMIIVLPIEALGMLLFFPRLPPAGSHRQLTPEEMRQLVPIFLVVWFLMVAVTVGAQAQAMRWMLRKTRWADFRIALVRPDA